MRFQELYTEAEVEQHVAALNRRGLPVVCDFETSDKNPRKAELVDIQLEGMVEDSAVIFSACYLPHLDDLEVPLVFHNMKYDLTVSYLHGTDLRGKRLYDTMLLHHLVDENAAHDLDSIIQARWQDDYKEKFWARFKNYTEADRCSQIDYSCRDIVYTRRFFDELRVSLKTEGIPQSLQDQVHALALALLDTEIHGIQIDLPYTIEMGTQLKSDIVRLEGEMRQLGGIACENLEYRQWAQQIDRAWTPNGKKWKTLPKPEFNFSSPAQVVELLYTELALPKQTTWDRVKKQERLTTDDAALAEIEHLHPVVPALRTYKKYSKMYGAFIESILEQAEEGRIHPGFNVNGTIGERISHQNPNMGQMPAKGDWAKIRGIFVPDAGHKLVTCDFRQVEVCVAAHFSQDPNLLKIIYEGASKHDITAEGVGLPRGQAKTLNFAMQYQCSPSKVADIVGCSKKDAQLIWNKYWETYAGEKRVIDECNAMVDRGEPIVTLAGRKRRFPKEFRSQGEKAAAYRQAYSFKIQSNAAIFTNVSFVEIAQALAKEKLGRAWFTVHDEVLAQANETRVEQVREIVQAKMLSMGPRFGLSVPLSVDCSPGLDRWTK